MRVETVKYKERCLSIPAPPPLMMLHPLPSAVNSCVYFLRMRVDAFSATA